MGSLLRKIRNQNISPELLACIDQEALTHLELLSANDKVDGDTLQEIRAMLAAYADMWELFSLFFFKVKHAGDVDEQRMQEIKNLHPRFCSIFKQVCVSEGKEPSPKWHVCNYHWLDFFVQNGFTWDGSEKAIEGSHGLIDRYAQQSAHFVEHEKKPFKMDSKATVAQNFSKSSLKSTNLLSVLTQQKIQMFLMLSWWILKLLCVHKFEMYLSVVAVHMCTFLN